MTTRATFEKARLPKISRAQWTRIGPIVGGDVDLGIMPHDLGNQASIPYDVALAVLLALFDNDLADAQWLIYHNNCVDHPVKVRKFEKGLPKFPRWCSECELPTEPEEFTLGLRFKLKGPITLV